MKSNKKIIAIALAMVMLAATFAACGKKKTEENISPSNSSSESEIETTVIKVTEYVPVTDTNGEQITNECNEVQTEVITKEQTIDIQTGKEITTRVSPQASESIKESNNDKHPSISNTESPISSTEHSTLVPNTTLPSTTKVPPTTSTKPPVTTTRPPVTTTKPQPTKPPETTAPANPYKYTGAWGSISKMEADCKAYVESLGGTYHKEYNLSSGGWVNSISGEAWNSPNEYKQYLFEEIKYNIKTEGFKNIRVVFVTVDNYNDGRCAEHAADIYCNQFTNYPFSNEIYKARIEAFIVYSRY